MNCQHTFASLYATFVVPESHQESNYFGLIKKLVELKNKTVPDSDDFRFWQQAIDQIYSLVADEITTSISPPTKTVSFGTSGWRGTLGKDLSARSVSQVTTAIIRMYQAIENADQTMLDALGVTSLAEAQQRGCVLGHDNRFGGELLAHAACDILTAYGFKVFYAGESTTGTLSAAVLELKAAFSINLTPSHNPLEYGGFKYNAADAGPAAPVLTDYITKTTRTIIANDSPFTDEPPCPAKVTTINALSYWQSLVRKNRTIHGLDYDSIINKFLATDDMVVVIDCVHGASRVQVEEFFFSQKSPRLFFLRTENDPTFGGIAPEPSSANFQLVANFLRQRQERFKLGVILDPDADRIRFTDGNTEISMNQFGAMAYHFLHEIKGKKGMVAKTVATSNFANAIATTLGEEIFEPPVGFKEFKPVMGQALVFFEESDGISIIGHTPEKDAYIGLLLAMDMILSLHQNLGEYALVLEKTYGLFCPERDGLQVSQSGKTLLETLATLEKFREGVAIPIGGRPMKIKKVIAIDGRKMILEDDSWLMIRPSGTEPKVRFYVEARSPADKDALFAAAKNMLAEIGLA